MFLRTSFVSPVYCFTAFVLWLLSVAMDGPLLSARGVSGAADFFLPVHIASLAVIGLFCPPQLFRRLVPAGCIATGLLTFCLALVDPSLQKPVILLLGVTGAVVAVGACVTLRQSRMPLLCAAYGLVIANILFLPLSIWPQGSLWQFAAVSAPLFAVPAMARRLPEISGDPEPRNLWHYLIFVLIFQVVGGLMYAFMMPNYERSALLPGAELLFYALAVITAYRVVQKNRDLALVWGVILAMAAFTFLQSGYMLFPVNLGMFAMQAAAGFVDLVLIAILLALPRPIRAFGFGLATVCAGIYAGRLIGHYYAALAESIVMSGHLVLNISILTLYFVGRYHFMESGRGIRILPAVEKHPPANPEVLEEFENVPASRIGMASPGSDIGGTREKLPDYLRLLLSEQEYRVLEKVIAGRTYRAAARELDISESTVKTYMRRICDKMEVNGKKKLFEKLNAL